LLIVAAAACLLQACAATPPAPSVAFPASPSPRVSPSAIAASTEASPARVVHTTEVPYVGGDAISLADLSGRVVTDDFEDVFAMDVDGSNFVRVASNPAGSEFVVYRDSTRGINVDDEVFVAGADGSNPRNLTNNPANDWGPDWSPDGSTIAFNSDRDGANRLRGYLMDRDGSNVRRIDVDTWLEYPAWSPDGTRLAFMGAVGSNYELFVVDLATNEVHQLTDSPGSDGWPAWSPDGTTIAFTSERDDCRYAAAEAPECWRLEDNDEHHDIWTIRPDGTGLRRVTPEIGQFVTWSPDGAYLLISGHALFVVRPDGTGRLELRTPEIPRALGGIPDWHP
jgi:WD40 repeat protein